MLRKLWKWLAATFSVVVILLALAIGLFRLMLPLIPQYHERIEAFASEAAGTPVRIGRITARWGFAGPELRFEDARLLTAAGDETLLSADEGRVVLDLRALVGAFEVRAGQVLLDGLVLDVQRNEAGEWRIGGRKVGGGDDRTPKRLALGLRDAQIVFRDAVTGAGPWVFDDVELNVDWRRRRLVVDSELRLPPGLGREAEFSIQADGDLADFDRVDWQAYLRGGDVEFFGWKPLMPAGRVVPASGRGDVVLWFSSRGSQLQQVSLRTDLRDVELARADSIVREFDLLQGRVEYDRLPGGWQGAGRDLVVDSDGERWPGADFSVEAVDAENGDSLLYADVDYARLDHIAPFADWLPDPAWRQRIAAMAPSGAVRDISLRLTRSAGALENFSLRADFEGLGFAAFDDYPGVRNLAGEIRMDRNGGRVELAPRAVVVELPELLGSPLASNRLSGALVWRESPRGWRILSDNIAIDHDAFRAQTDFELLLSEDAGPVLDAHADLSRMTLAGLRQLLPRPVLPPNVFDWLEAAFASGEIPVATVDFNGPLQAFPFAGGEGEFRVVAEIVDARIEYAPNWPAATDVHGTVVFQNSGVRGAVTRAQLGGNRVASAEVAIPDMRQPVFEMHTVADGTLDSLHAFLRATPVAARLGRLVNRLEVAGDGSAQVDLHLPLSKALGLRTDLSVIVSTESGAVGLAGWAERLEAVAGSVHFRNGEFSGRNIAARLLDAPVIIDLQPDVVDTGDQTYPATVATVRGEVSGRALARLHERLAEPFRGVAPYTATVTLPAQRAALPVSLDIASRLEGMGIVLPAPLGKRPTESRSLRLRVALPEDAAQADLVYGDVANARVDFVAGDKGWQLARGGVHLGVAPAELPEGQGLAVTGTAKRLDLGGWLELITGAGRDPKPGGQAGPAAAVELRGMRVEVDELEAFGQLLREARLTVDRSEREWLVQIDSDVAAGALFVPFDLQDEPIIANMQLLHIGAGADEPAGTVRGDGEDEPDPRAIPSMKVEADDFRLGDMRLGRLSATLERDADGVVVPQFETASDAFSTSGSGRWVRYPTGQRTELALALSSSDVRTTLEHLGFEGVIDAEGAEVTMALAWPGPPGRELRERISGEVSVSVGPGQIDSVNPGAGRALGLLSFTALPRRLSLDFRDVFDKGFGFDYIEGDFRLEDGDAYTSNLVLEGPAAQVGIAGRTGLAARDYDQTAVVYGNFGAALPVAGAIAGGPVGGAAMLIFSELFKRPLQNMARANYRITGSWDDPDIERVLAQATEEGAS